MAIVNSIGGPSEPYEVKIEGQSTGDKLNQYSGTWKYIENRLREDLQTSREKNDAAHLDEKKTNLIRGKIRYIKQMLEWPNEKN